MALLATVGASLPHGDGTEWTIDVDDALLDQIHAATQAGDEGVLVLVSDAIGDPVALHLKIEPLLSAAIEQVQGAIAILEQED